MRDLRPDAVPEEPGTSRTRATRGRHLNIFKHHLVVVLLDAYDQVQLAETSQFVHFGIAEFTNDIVRLSEIPECNEHQIVDVDPFASPHGSSDRRLNFLLFGTDLVDDEHAAVAQHFRHCRILLRPVVIFRNEITTRGFIHRSGRLDATRHVGEARRQSLRWR